MEEELKKVNDFRKTCSSILLKFYRNTSNGVMTHNLNNNSLLDILLAHLWGAYAIPLALFAVCRYSSVVCRLCPP